MCHTLPYLALLCPLCGNPLIKSFQRLGRQEGGGEEVEGEENAARRELAGTVNIIDDIIASKRCVPPFPSAVDKHIWEAPGVGLPGGGSIGGT